MELRYRIGSALFGLSLALAPGAVPAQGVVKLGMVGEFSGPFAQYGQQILGDKLVAAMKGAKLVSPPGPLMIDPATRDVVQTVYIRRVEKVGGQLANVEFDNFPEQKDPGK